MGLTDRRGERERERVVTVSHNEECVVSISPNGKNEFLKACHAVGSKCSGQNQSCGHSCEY